MAKTSDSIPKGRRYSLLYCPRPEEQTDSARFRHRLGMIADAVQGDDIEGFSLKWERTTGIPRFVDGKPRRDDRWMYDLEQVELSVALDTITVIYEYLGKSQFDLRQKQVRKDYISEVRRVLSEERILFAVDDYGGVHPKIDTAFAALRSSAIHGMASPRYETANLHIEKIDEALMKDPPDGANAIRSAFDAAENIFKMMFRKPQKLAERELNVTLKEWVRREYPDNYPSEVVAAKTYESFVSWVTAAHFYRHQRGHSKPHQPPYDIAVLMVSQGLTFIRWLVAIDQKMLATPSSASTSPAD